MGNRNKNEVFDFDGRNRIEKNVAIRRRESRFGRDLFIKAWTWTRVQDCLQDLSVWHLQAGLPVQQHVFPASDVPAAHAGLGAGYPQRQHGHQDLDEGLQVHKHITAITVPRVYFKSREG